MSEEREGEEIAEEIGEAVEEALSEPLAAAIEAQESAEEIAEEIAAGAMESARGARIESLERDVSECRTTLDQLPGMLAEQFNLTLEPLRAGLASVEARLLASEAARSAPVIVAEPEPSPSELTPPPSAEIVEPAIVEEPPLEPESPAPRRKHRFL